MIPKLVSHSGALFNSVLTQSTTTTIGLQAPPPTIRRDQSAADKPEARPTDAERSNLANHIEKVRRELKTSELLNISDSDVALLVRLDRAVQQRKDRISAAKRSGNLKNVREILPWVVKGIINADAYGAKTDFFRAAYQVMGANSDLTNTQINENRWAPSIFARRSGDQATSNLESAMKRLESARGEIHNMIIQLTPKN
jgi:hypothetical protein